MNGSSITKTVTSTVVLGSYGYGNVLSITPTGAIEPSSYGSTALYAPAGLSGVTVHNAGHIAGAYGGRMAAELPAGAGGIGVDLASNATLGNRGTIAGGDGGIGYLKVAGIGGRGVDLAAGGRVVTRVASQAAKVATATMAAAALAASESTSRRPARSSTVAR